MGSKSFLFKAYIEPLIQRGVTKADLRVNFGIQTAGFAAVNCSPPRQPEDKRLAPPARPTISADSLTPPAGRERQRMRWLKTQSQTLAAQYRCVTAAQVLHGSYRSIIARVCTGTNRRAICGIFADLTPPVRLSRTLNQRGRIDGNSICPGADCRPDQR